MLDISLYVISDVLSFIFAVSANLTLLYLIAYKTPLQMRGYSTVLRVHAFNDLYYCILNFSTTVETFSYAGNLYLVLSGFIRHVSAEYGWILFCAYYQGIMLELCLTPIDFYYRYQTVCKNRTLPAHRVYLMFAGIFFLTFLHAFPVYLSFGKFGPSFDGIEEAEATLNLQELIGTTENTPSFTFSSTNQFMFYVNLGILFSGFAVVYCMVIWAFAKIHKTVKRHARSNKSSRVARMEQQINKVILLQFIIPFLGNGAPVMLTTTTSMLRIDFAELGKISRVLCAWIAVLKPVVTISLIPTYRRRVLGLARINVLSSTMSSADQEATKPNGLSRVNTISSQAVLKPSDT
ncbi:unnamed protein product [Bursaphelenchus xylophilus]|uniref:(pine wood nematode) hypothetical protein n=1 Tax=Bursaphelenchus xylophilus TaxID=6326 RepID=A0A1I7RMG4_BURXY|nr:unnamed protein product [Bursaphelenchus xylophilus]CAG9118465.1 unnamed protein product [Bursaphelenchus xylophilus]